MPVGTSLGGYFEDDAHHAIGNDTSDKEEGITIKPVAEKDPNDMTNQFNTELDSNQKADYDTKFKPNASYDYDMQGWYKANPGADPNGEGVHYPDTFKKPNHPTFSDQSQYSNEQTPGGKWEQQPDQSYTFTPGSTNLQYHDPNDLRDYFNKVEPNNKLIFPDTAAGMAAQASEKAAGALKSSGGTQVAPQPNASPEAPERDSSQDIYVNPWVTITPEDIDTGINVGLSAGPGTMAGVVSKTFDKGALAVAQAAEKEGIKGDELFQKTGWFRGADNRWRYEIDDSASKFTGKFPGDIHELDSFHSKAKLSEVLDHPELYQAYPELKNLDVIRDPMYKPKSAQFSGDAIRMGTAASKDKGILMHEVQHAVQDIEGFAKGGEPGKVGKDFQLRYEADVNKLRPMYFDLQRKEMAGETLSERNQAVLDYLRHVFKRYAEYSRLGDVKSRENYLRLAGETEARNTQTRVDLGPEDRMRFTPSATEDTLPANQIISDTPIRTTAYTK